MRIAICEDEEFIQNSIEKNVEKCLEITGMAGKCECFVSAEELLEKGNMPYALYILDVEMKKLSGLELAEHIRTEDRNAVIIFMTNHSEMMQKAFDVQAFQYLVGNYDVRKSVYDVRRNVFIFISDRQDGSLLCDHIRNDMDCSKIRDTVRRNDRNRSGRNCRVYAVCISSVGVLCGRVQIR